MAEPDLMEEGEIVDDDDEDVQEADDSLTSAAVSSSSTADHGDELGLSSNKRRQQHGSDGGYAEDNDEDEENDARFLAKHNGKQPQYDDEIDEDELMGTSAGISPHSSKKRALLVSRQTSEPRVRAVITFRADGDDGATAAAGGSQANFKRQRQGSDDEGSTTEFSNELRANFVGHQKFAKRPCKFWLRGHCKDAYCSYPHEHPNGFNNNSGKPNAPADFEPNSSGSRESRESGGTNVNNAMNSTAAAAAAAATIGGDERKYEPCKYYLLGGCWRGPKCPYLHGDFPCKFFHTGAKCHKGFKCRFSHATPLAPEYRQALYEYLSKDQMNGGDKYANLLLLPKPAAQQQHQPNVTPPKQRGNFSQAVTAEQTASPSKGKRSPPPLPNAPRRALLALDEQQQQLPFRNIVDESQPADATATAGNNGPVVFPAPPSIFLERLATHVGASTANNAADGSSTLELSDPRNRRTTSFDSFSAAAADSAAPKTEVALRRSPPPSKAKSRPNAEIVKIVPHDAKPVNFELSASSVRCLLPTPATVFNDDDESSKKRNARVVQNDDEDEDGVADGLKPPSRTLSRRSPPLDTSSATQQPLTDNGAGDNKRLHEQQPDARWAISDRRATNTADAVEATEVRSSGRRSRFGPALENVAAEGGITQFPPPPPALVAHLKLGAVEEQLPAAAAVSDPRNRSFHEDNERHDRLEQQQLQQHFPGDPRAPSTHQHQASPIDGRFGERHYSTSGSSFVHEHPHDRRPAPHDLMHAGAHNDTQYNAHSAYFGPRDPRHNNADQHFQPLLAGGAYSDERSRQYLPPPDLPPYQPNSYAPPNLMHSQLPPLPRNAAPDDDRFYGSRFPPAGSRDFGVPPANMQPPPLMHPGEHTAYGRQQQLYEQQQQQHQRLPLSAVGRYMDERGYDNAEYFAPRDVYADEDGRREYAGALESARVPVPEVSADPRRRAAAPASTNTAESAGINMPDLNSVVEALQKRLVASAAAAGGGGVGGLQALLPSLTILTPTLDASFEMLPEGTVAQWNLEEFDGLAATVAESRLKVAQKFLRRSQKTPDELQADPRLRNLLAPEAIIHADRERRLSEAEDQDEEQSRLQHDMDHFSYRVLEDLQRKKKQQIHVMGQHQQHAREIH